MRLSIMFVVLEVRWGFRFRNSLELVVIPLEEMAENSVDTLSQLDAATTRAEKQLQDGFDKLSEWKSQTTDQIQTAKQSLGEVKEFLLTLQQWVTERQAEFSSMSNAALAEANDTSSQIEKFSTATANHAESLEQECTDLERRFADASSGVVDEVENCIQAIDEISTDFQETISGATDDVAARQSMLEEYLGIAREALVESKSTVESLSDRTAEITVELRSRIEESAKETLDTHRSKIDALKSDTEEQIELLVERAESVQETLVEHFEAVSNAIADTCKNIDSASEGLMTAKDSLRTGMESSTTGLQVALGILEETRELLDRVG